MKNKILVFLTIILLMISNVYIFGKEKYFNFNEKIIFIDPGHGGKDDGASYNFLLEDEINLSISKILIEKLVDRGAYVYTSRIDDYDLADKYSNNRKIADLKKRVSLINTIKPDLFLSVHLNTFKDSRVSGGQVFYQNNEQSEMLAFFLQEEFNLLSNKDKKAKFGDYFLLKYADSIGVLIECGFLTNIEEANRLNNKYYQEQIVSVIIRGIEKYFIDTEKNK